MPPPHELLDAIEAHDLATVAALLRAGADPNGCRQDGPYWPPLKGAIEELTEGGPIEAVVLLLRHGASVHGVCPGDATPLLVAVLNRQFEAAHLLLAAGADPNARNDEGQSILCTAVSHGDLALVQLLLDCGADIETHGMINAATPLGWAADRLDIPMIKLLLQAGANPQAYDAWGHFMAYEELPPRDECNGQLWDEAMRLMRGE
jgi:ankyrin repeat protein